MSTTAYTGRTTNWPSLILAAILLIPLLGFAIASGPVDGSVVLLSALAILAVLGAIVTSSDVRTTCGPQGVSVHGGAVGWPRMRYALDDIVDASVVRVDWWSVSYGFWWTPTRTLCTVRTGPALRLRLRSGRLVTISVPDPQQAVATLERARGSAARRA